MFLEMDKAYVVAPHPPGYALHAGTASVDLCYHGVVDVILTNQREWYS
jgi:hypothetical protein